MPGLLLINPRAGPGLDRTTRSARSPDPGSSLEAAVDGEPAVLETPLEFSIEPRALRVLLPRAPG
ncbi:MAG TPA: hypothetical protein VGJ27_01140 [Gaiellaceae bacterium]